MVRALSLLLLGVVTLAFVATPGLAGVALLLVPFALIAVVWWIALGAGASSRRTEAVVRVRHRELLGPGGPDDSFSGARSDDVRY